MRNVREATDAASAGVVTYRMSPDEPGTFLATWYATRSDDPAVGTGVAHGDTAQGFVGEHRVTYYDPSGALSGGPFDLSIKRAGDIREMSWRRDGVEVFRGVGIETGDQLVAAYWFLAPPAA
jgi:hypothetical protein